MSKIKAAIRKNEVDKSGKVNIKIRIYHNGKTRYIGTKFYVKPTQFSVEKGRVLKSNPMFAFINAELKKLEANYETKLVTTEGLDNRPVKVVVSTLRRKKKIVNFFDLLDAKIEESKGKDGSTWEKYSTTKKVLLSYYGMDNLPMVEIDEAFLKDFMESRLSDGKSVNTVAIDLRNIRAIFNKAIDDEIIQADLYPFRKFKIPSKKTSKRSLTIKQLKTLYKAKLSGKEKQSIDVFFLSFFLIGINMKDLFRLRPDNIRDGRIVYDRAKTKKEYSIKIEPEAMAIINRYKAKEGEWLFTFPEQYARTYEFNKAVNKFIRRVAVKKKINVPITTYYARHSWATIAYNNGIPKDDVRLALGHGAETVTDTYIDFDLALVDSANRKIIDLIV